MGEKLHIVKYTNTSYNSIQLGFNVHIQNKQL